MSDSSKDRIQGKVDEFKGKTKEAAGDLTGDEQQQSEGQMDQAKGKVKQGVADLKDKADNLIKKTTD
jgi:uncharacterized protein YjbJ (UPF0337 family)